MKVSIVKNCNKGTLSLFLGLCIATGSQAADFIVLGNESNEAITTLPLGVSLDGSVIVGKATTDAGEEAFRWTETNGLELLGDLPGGAVQSVAYGVSMDGKVVVGQATNGEGKRAFRWHQDDGMFELGYSPSGGPATIARGVSADGKIVVGATRCVNYCDTSGGIVDGESEPFRWTESTGVEPLATDAVHPANGSTFQISNGIATGISADGKIISGLVSGSPGHFLFQWNSEDGLYIPEQANSGRCQVFNIPIPGYGQVKSCQYGFTWYVGSLATSGVAFLNNFDGGRLSTPVGITSINMTRPLAVSADATVVIGDNSIWTKSGGTQNLADFLISKGLGTELAGWSNIKPTAISADGRTIVGSGQNSSGKVVGFKAQY